MTQANLFLQDGRVNPTALIGLTITKCDREFHDGDSPKQDPEFFKGQNTRCLVLGDTELLIYIGLNTVQTASREVYGLGIGLGDGSIPNELLTGRKIVRFEHAVDMSEDDLDTLAPWLLDFAFEDADYLTGQAVFVLDNGTIVDGRIADVQGWVLPEEFAAM